MTKAEKLQYLQDYVASQGTQAVKGSLHSRIER